MNSARQRIVLSCCWQDAWSRVWKVTGNTIYVYILSCQSVPLGNLLLQKIKDTDKYKYLYMAIFNTKNLDMKVQYLVGGIMFDGFIQGTVRWQLNTANVIDIHVVRHPRSTAE